MTTSRLEDAIAATEAVPGVNQIASRDGYAETSPYLAAHLPRPVDALISLFSDARFVPPGGLVVNVAPSLDYYEFLIPLVQPGVRVLVVSAHHEWELSAVLMRTKRHVQAMFEEMQISNPVLLEKLGVTSAEALRTLVRERVIFRDLAEAIAPPVSWKPPQTILAETPPDESRIRDAFRTAYAQSLEQLPLLDRISLDKLPAYLEWRLNPLSQKADLVIARGPLHPLTDLNALIKDNGLLWIASTRLEQVLPFPFAAHPSVVFSQISPEIARFGQRPVLDPMRPDPSPGHTTAQPIDSEVFLFSVANPEGAK